MDIRQGSPLNVSDDRNLLNLNIEELGSLVEALGEKSFRGRQLFGWFSRAVTDFDEMSNIPAGLKTALKSEGRHAYLPVAKNMQRSKDGTLKCLFEFNYDDNFIDVESVFMKYAYGNSICISSQAGCRMGCRFCASTIGGLERNLSGGEMLGEVLAMKLLTGEAINHVVIMGMGEPFDNYNETARFISLIHDPAGYGMSLRNITVSTCGIIEGIERFASDFPQANLAISLHAPNQEIREKTMPIAIKYCYDDLIGAAKDYTEISGRRITFEYALIDKENDSPDCAKELAAKLKGWRTHVNLIPLNNVEGREYRSTATDKVNAFKDILEKEGVAVTVRRTLGSDIDAACGQLRRREGQ